MVLIVSYSYSDTLKGGERGEMGEREDGGVGGGERGREDGRSKGKEEVLGVKKIAGKRDDLRVVED